MLVRHGARSCTISSKRVVTQSPRSLGIKVAETTYQDRQRGARPLEMEQYCQTRWHRAQRRVGWDSDAGSRHVDLLGATGEDPPQNKRAIKSYRSKHILKASELR